MALTNPVDLGCSGQVVSQVCKQKEEATLSGSITLAPRVSTSTVQTGGATLGGGIALTGTMTVIQNEFVSLSGSIALGASLSGQSAGGSGGGGGGEDDDGNSIPVDPIEMPDTGIQ